ncbi:hypothetical protein BKA70DRAFT_1127733 [Coprinopsis sp. MPI-PUGE-AT-0042]|nr:hypothetical protein BKA70DRAFT_1127733 [Coprinopsis sp. MPI-PUGE-AT-0042]
MVVEEPEQEEEVRAVEVNVDFVRRSTASKLSKLNSESIYEAVKRVNNAMGESPAIDLPIYLDAVSWGSEECIRDASIRFQRSALLHSSQLPGILDRWETPPRSSSGITRPVGASNALESFAVKTTARLIEKELKVIGPLLRLPSGKDITREELTSRPVESVIQQMKEKGTLLWELLENCLASRDQRSRNTHKDSEKVTCKSYSPLSRKIIFTIVSMIVYSRSHHFNQLQKLLAIYMKFRGLSAKGFDTLHALGLTMSHKWASNHVKNMSGGAMKEVGERMEQFPWVSSYDNLTIPFRVFSQRLDNQSELGQGTAATVYVMRDAPRFGESINKALKEQRATGQLNPLTSIDIFNLEVSAYPVIQERMVFEVLTVLLQCPEFGIASYDGRTSDALKPPPPVDQLPWGPDHTTLQYLMGTVPIPETSYEDHSKLVNEWLNQLGVRTLAERIKFAATKIVGWVGDQLTVDRLRRLFTFLSDEDNSFDRLDFSFFVFGWLHLQMAFANSLHKQYLGTTKGRGLAQAFELLNRRGLSQVRTQGPFHHDLVEALKHVATAHLLVDWINVSGVDTVQELRQKTPDDLQRLARKIVDKMASSEELDRMDHQVGSPDQQRRQVVMWNRDVLHYMVLDRAIKSGDVGVMEAFLPLLLYRFVGGGNGKYAIEVLELLQGLHREWPKEVADFVRHHCWLVNFSGKQSGFCAVDRSQEMNIKDIKVTYRSEGASIKWDYFKILHPAIPVIRAVIDFVESEFDTLARGKRHTVPSARKDIDLLRANYTESTYHKNQPGRKIHNAADEAKDVITRGANTVQSGVVLENWVANRTFVRSKKEHYHPSEYHYGNSTTDNADVPGADGSSESATEVGLG